MSYALQAGETPGEGLARVIREQAAKLDAECARAMDRPERFVHGARVRAKKVRAALRMARPLMAAHDYKRENQWWRDAARGISEARDHNARLEALNALAGFLEAEVGVAATKRLRARFLRDRATFVREKGAAEAIDAFRAALKERGTGAPRIEHGDREAAVKAYGQSYRDARRRMKEAFSGGSADALHEWRKAVKRHALQTRLVRGLFAAVSGGLDERMEATGELAALLGDLQDLEILVQALDKDEDAAAISVLEGRRVVMTDSAQASGRLLFGEKRRRWAETLRGSGD